MGRAPDGSGHLVNDAVDAAAAQLRGPLDLDDPAPKDSFPALVARATIESSRAMTYGTVSVVVMLAPMFVLGGLAGASFYPPAAVAAITALLSSALVSLTVSPVLAVLLLRRPPGRRSPDGGAGACTRAASAPAPAASADRRCRSRTDGSRGRGRADAAGPGAAPDLREPHVLVRWDGAAGTALPEMNRIGTRVSDELRGIPGVVNVGSHFGRAVTSDQAVGANAGMVWASISPDADYDRTVAAIQDVTAGYPAWTSG